MFVESHPFSQEPNESGPDKDSIGSIRGSTNGLNNIFNHILDIFHLILHVLFDISLFTEKLSRTFILGNTD
jgi:hypothetical protein